jgi:hypothetical protein
MDACPMFTKRRILFMIKQDIVSDDSWMNMQRVDLAFHQRRQLARKTPLAKDEAQYCSEVATSSSTLNLFSG